MCAFEILAINHSVDNHVCPFPLFSFTIELLILLHQVCVCLNVVILQHEVVGSQMWVFVEELLHVEPTNERIASQEIAETAIPLILEGDHVVLVFRRDVVGTQAPSVVQRQSVLGVLGDESWITSVVNVDAYAPIHTVAFAPVPNVVILVFLRQSENGFLLFVVVAFKMIDRHDAEAAAVERH